MINEPPRRKGHQEEINLTLTQRTFALPQRPFALKKYYILSKT
jgi:hypothetical protein